MMKRNSSKGFTLVELLIVIAIIGLLMALLVVLIQGLMDRARYAKTQSMVKAMMVGCEMYKADFAGQYPPVSAYGQGSSKNLHWYLGRQRFVSEGQSTSGGGIVKKKMGIDFNSDWLDGNPSSSYPQPGQAHDVVDGWMRIISYDNPNPNVPAGSGPSFLIVSKGADEADPDDDTTSADSDF